MRGEDEVSLMVGDVVVYFGKRGNCFDFVVVYFGIWNVLLDVWVFERLVFWFGVFYSLFDLFCFV